MDWDSIVPLVEDKLSGYVEAFVAATPRIAAALLILLLTWGAVKLARFAVRQVAKRTRMRSNLTDVLQMLASTGLWLMGLLIALAVIFPTITPAKALTTLGLGSVAIGFAFKDTFENFLAGILILLREPFAINDFIECEDVEGQIEEITIRDTHIRQTDGQLVVMPNHMLFKNPVTVRTDRDLRRVTVICGVAYGEDVDAAREVIFNAVKKVDTVRDDVRDVQVFAQEFGDSAINFEVTWWTGSRPAPHWRSAIPMKRPKNEPMRSAPSNLPASATRKANPQAPPTPTCRIKTTSM